MKFTDYELSYLEYIQNHRGNLVKAYDLLHDKFIQLGATEEELDALKSRIMIHDLNKYDRDSFDAYVKRFYRGKDNMDDLPEDTRNWINSIVEKHQTINPHHPEHFTANGTVMGNVDTMEMLCDWEAMSIAFNSKTIDWYKANKDKIKSRDGEAVQWDYLDKYFGEVEQPVTEGTLFRGDL